MRRIATVARVLPLALALSAAPLRAQQQQGSSPIDDLIKRAQDAFNDLRYSRADSLAREVLLISSITQAQRTGALLVQAAAAYPEEATAQRRAVALATLKQVVRSNISLRMPQELTWAGLDSLVEEARRTTFGIEVRAQSNQVAVGPNGTATIHVRGSRAGKFMLYIMPANSNAAVVVDSLAPTASGTFTFGTMRNERPVFTSGEYTVMITGIDAAARDTVTVQYPARVEAAPWTFATVPARMDSSRLLPERTKGFGAKSILPAILVGGMAFALSNTLRAEGVKETVGADSRGIAVGGALAVSTLLAGFMDKGRVIPANIAANRTMADAFQKSITDAQAENRRRVAEYRTSITIDLETR